MSEPEPRPTSWNQHPVFLVLLGIAVSTIVFVTLGAITDHRHDRGAMGTRAWHGGDRHHGSVRPSTFGEPSTFSGAPEMSDTRPPAMMHDGNLNIMHDALASLGVTDAQLTDALIAQINKLEKQDKLTAREADELRVHVTRELS